MRRNIIAKIISFFAKENRSLVFTLAFLLIFSVSTYALAAARAQPYTPGATNDPTDCNPGETNCFVNPISPLTAGGVAFTSSTGSLTQDNASLFFDDTTNALGIGTASPAATSILDLTSTTKGFLPPRMTTVQKDAIASPATGLTIYDTTLGKLNVYNGSAWKNVGSAEIGGEVTSATEGSVFFAGASGVLAQDNASLFFDDSTNRLGVGTATVSAKIHSLATTEQFRAGYDASNYLSTTVGSTGNTIFDLTGTSPTFRFSDDVGVGTAPSAGLHVLKTTEQLRVGYDASNYYSTTVSSTGGITLNAVGSGSLFTLSDSLVISGANSINFDDAAGVNITGAAGVASNVRIGISNTAATSGVARTIVGSVNTINATANYSTILGRTNVLTSAESEVTILGNFNTMTDADSGHIIIGGTNTTNFTGGSTSRGTFNIGYYNSVVHNFSSIIGSYQTTTATNQLIIADANDNNNGPESAGYNDVYFGTGPRRSAAGVKGSNVTINGSGAASATATDVAGGHLTIAGGKGTGAGISGDVYISTATVLGSGTTLQSLTQRMVVEGNTGDVGIGDLTPSYRLEVANDVAEYVANIFNDGNAATRSGLRIQAGLDDHTAAGPSTLIGFFDGDGGAVGSITFGSSATAYNTTSDQRLKQNITDTSLSLALLNEIQVRDYTFIADSTNTKRHGFIAQELYEKYPDAVTRPIDESTGYWMVDYSKLTPLIIAAVQDLDVKISGLDPETDTSYAGRLVAWMGSAGNGIGDFFVGRVHTPEICVGTPGNETCIDKAQLDQILMGGTTSSTSGTTTGDTSTDGGSTDTTGTTSGDTGTTTGTETGSEDTGGTGDTGTTDGGTGDTTGTGGEEGSETTG